MQSENGVLAQISGGLLGQAAYRLRTELAGQAIETTLDLDVPDAGRRARVRFVKTAPLRKSDRFKRAFWTPSHAERI